MQFVHHIVHAGGRFDLLAAAVRASKPLWKFTSIIDNTPDGQITRLSRWPIPVIRPSVPLSCAQSMNFMQRLAEDRGAKAWGYQHSDAEPVDGTCDNFLVAVQEAISGAKKWAAIFTHYDILSAYNTAAVKAIGPWDAHFPMPNYTIDQDWFYRCRLAGYELIETGLQVNHLSGGSTSHRVAGRIQSHYSTAGMNEAYYKQKWGGAFNSEKFTRPWDWHAVKIFGLQRTGTNLASRLLTTNFHVHVLSEREPDFTGWKHGRMERGEWSDLADYVLCVKHPIAWLCSCYDYFQRDFGKDTTICPHFRRDMSLKDFCHSRHYEFKNPVERWNLEYASWLRELPAARRLIFRVEDSLEDFPPRVLALGHRQQEFVAGKGWALPGNQQIDVDGRIIGEVRSRYYQERQYLGRIGDALAL